MPLTNSMNWSLDTHSGSQAAGNTRLAALWQLQLQSLPGRFAVCPWLWLINASEQQIKMLFSSSSSMRHRRVCRVGQAHASILAKVSWPTSTATSAGWPAALCIMRNQVSAVPRLPLFVFFCCRRMWVKCFLRLVTAAQASLSLFD